MARDPGMPLADVRWVLGHARLSTTQLYLTPLTDDVIASVVAFHARQAGRQPVPGSQDRADALSGYWPESLKILFGRPGERRPGPCGIAAVYRFLRRDADPGGGGGDAAFPAAPGRAPLA
jgi:hypothetical protein